jgi:outer membrane protein assembly factor BamB
VVILVYAGSNDGKVYALRASDGKQLWSFTADGPVESQIARPAGSPTAAASGSTR